MYCRLNQAIINGCRIVCYQGITFTVSFCEHSHTFVKIDEFVMELPGQMALRRDRHIHALLKILHVTTWTYNMGLLDHCLGRSVLELITNCHPQPPYQPLPILTFTCTRTGKTLRYFFLQNKESFYSNLLSKHLIFK